MRCAICNKRIERDADRWVRTMDGAAVHLMCSERESQQMWRQRQYWAIGHLLAIEIVSLVLLLHDGVLNWPAWLILAWLALHRLLHRRWWHYRERDLRNWWRRHKSG